MKFAELNIVTPLSDTDMPPPASFVMNKDDDNSDNNSIMSAYKRARPNNARWLVLQQVFYQNILVVVGD